MWVWSFWFPAPESLALKNLQLLQSQDTELSPFPCPFTCPYTLHYPLFFLTLHQTILITQNILSFDHDVHVPYNTTLTTPEIACLMENQQPLHALDGLLLVTLSLSEAQKSILPPSHSPTRQPPLWLTWSLPPHQKTMQLLKTLLERISNLEKEDKIKAQKISYLEDEDKIKAQEISDLKNKVADIKLLADAIHLQCLLDCWLLKWGFGSGNRSREEWINKNKKKTVHWI